jgi:hypothetical protein
MRKIVTAILTLALPVLFTACSDRNNYDKGPMDEHYPGNSSTRQEPDNTKDAGKDSTNIGHPTDSSRHTGSGH